MSDDDGTFPPDPGREYDNDDDSEGERAPRRETAAEIKAREEREYREERRRAIVKLKRSASPDAIVRMVATGDADIEQFLAAMLARAERGQGDRTALPFNDAEIRALELALQPTWRQASFNKMRVRYPDRFAYVAYWAK